MKSIITGFFEEPNLDKLESKLALMVKHGVDHLAIREYDHRPLVELSDGEIKKLLLDTKGMRVKFSILDAGILPYDPYNARKHQDAIDTFKYMLKIADRLKITYILLNLPEINDIIQEYSTYEKIIGDYLDQAMRQGKKIVINPQKGYKSNTYVYILKKMKSKHLTIAFDPVLIMQNNESTTTAYRILKPYISVVYAHDANQKHEPELIGFGKADTAKILKKLTRDRFDGFVIVDHHFHKNLFDESTIKLGFFKKIFSNEKKVREKRISELSKRIFPDEETKNVTADDILENQIKVIEKIMG